MKNISDNTYDSILADKAQRDYCNEKGYPHFAPSSRCYRCKQDIYAEEGRLRDSRIVNGISVERAKRELITGCPFCNWSYCE